MDTNLQSVANRTPISNNHPPLSTYALTFRLVMMEFRVFLLNAVAWFTMWNGTDTRRF